jgi:hypothetical protein
MNCDNRFAAGCLRAACPLSMASRNLIAGPAAPASCVAAQSSPPRSSANSTVGVVLIAHEVCYVLWREESVSHRLSAKPDVKSTSGKRDRPLHIIAGRIAEIGDGYVLLGFSSAPIQLTDKLADGFYPGQRVTITATVIDGEFIAQKIVLD